MAMSKQRMIRDFTGCFLGTPFESCCVGITSDVPGRLFGDHKVSQALDRWIYRTASSHLVAREVEAYFLSAGMDGGSGGGDRKSQIVYAYRKTQVSIP
jgi:hypothetical protein